MCVSFGNMPSSMTCLVYAVIHSSKQYILKCDSSSCRLEILLAVHQERHDGVHAGTAQQNTSAQDELETITRYA